MKIRCNEIVTPAGVIDGLVIVEDGKITQLVPAAELKEEAWDEDLSLIHIFHLIVCSSGTLPIAYFMWWMPHTLIGFGCYFGLFFAIYAAIWLIEYSLMKRRVNLLNQQLKAHNQA